MRVVLLCALAGVLLVPATASAKVAYDCPRHATVTGAPVGELGPGGATPTQEVAHGPLYAARDDVVLHYGGFDFAIDGGSIFGINCSGAAGATAVADPMLDLQMGHATVATGGGGHFGTIGTEEMLLDPYSGRRMTIDVRRTPRHSPSLDEVLAAGPHALTFGSSSARRTAGSGYLNVTPHLGWRRRTNGQCHQAQRARAVSRGYRVRHGALYVRGRIRYRGLASFSPR